MAPPSDAPPPRRTKVTVQSGRVVRKTGPGIAVAMQVVTRYPDRATFLERFARMVEPDGMVVAARTNRVPGSRVPFVVTLADQSRMLEGEAEIVKPASAGEVGTRLRFIALTPESREVLAELLRVKAEPPRWLQAGAGKPRRVDEVALGELHGFGMTTQGTPPPPPFEHRTAEIDVPAVFPDLIAATQPEGLAAVAADPPKPGPRKTQPSPAAAAQAANSGATWPMGQPPSPGARPTTLPAIPPPPADLVAGALPLGAAAPAPPPVTPAAVTVASQPAPFLATAPFPGPNRTSNPSLAPPSPALAFAATIPPPSPPPSGMPTLIEPIPATFPGAAATPASTAGGSSTQPAAAAPFQWTPSLPPTESPGLPGESTAHAPALWPPGSQQLPANDAAPAPSSRRRALLLGAIGGLAILAAGAFTAYVFLAPVDPDAVEAEPPAEAFRPPPAATVRPKSPPSAVAVKAGPAGVKSEGAVAPPAAAVKGSLPTPSVVEAKAPPAAPKAAPPTAAPTSDKPIVAVAATVAPAKVAAPPVAPAPVAGPKIAPSLPVAPTKLAAEKEVVVAKAAPPAPPSSRAAAAAAPKAAAKAEPRSDCRAVVNSDPSGATILVDGKRRGVTPSSLDDLPCERTTRIILSSSGRRRYVAEVTPSAHLPVEVDAKLARLESRLVIWSKPAGATVRIDGLVAGRTPVSAESHPPAELRIEIELPGYKTWRSKIWIRGNYTTVSPVLEPIAEGEAR